MTARRKQHRANGEGTIYQRKDGRWEAAAYVLTTDGTEKRQRLYGRTREEVHSELVRLLDQSRRGIPVPDSPWKVGEYLDYWLEQVAKPSVRPTTYAKYEQAVRLYLKPGLGRQRLDRMSVKAVQGFLNRRLQAGDSISKVQIDRMVLGVAVSRAMREELVSRNVARLATIPKGEPRQMRSWSADEARTFLATAADDPLYSAFVLLFVYGLRRGEVLGLSWQDVDFDADELHIRQHLLRVAGQLQLGPVKTRAGRRTLPLLPMVRDALKRQEERQTAARERAGGDWHETGLVFTTGSGKPVEPRNLARSFERLSEQADLRPIRLHDLRHTCASLLKRLGVPPRDAMEILGHSRISITMEVYTHVDDSSRREALGKLGNLLDDEE